MALTPGRSIDVATVSIVIAANGHQYQIFLEIILQQDPALGNVERNRYVNSFAELAISGLVGVSVTEKIALLTTA